MTRHPRRQSSAFLLRVAGGLALVLIGVMTLRGLAPMLAQVTTSKPVSWADELERFVSERANNDTFSGVVFIAKGGTPVFEKAYGMANKGFSVPNRVDTKFNIASMTKMFTGVAIAQLAQSGKLHFADTVSQHLPDFHRAIADRVTIHQLLTHTSGMGSIWKQEYHRGNHALYRDLKDFLPLFQNDPLQFEPGAKWSYSNAGFMVLGAILEKAGGQQYGDYVRQHIFEAAGMRDTGSVDIERPVPNLAVPYTRQNWTMPGEKDWTSAVLIGLVNMIPAGGATSNAPDLLKFSRALTGFRLLNQEFTQQLITGRFEYRPGVSYAYGIADERVQGHRILFHDGGADGISANMDIFLALDYTAIVLSNYDHPAVNPVKNKIRQLLMAAPAARQN